MTEGHPERHQVVAPSKIVGDYDASTHFIDDVAVYESRRTRPLLLRDWQVGANKVWRRCDRASEVKYALRSSDDHSSSSI